MLALAVYCQATREMADGLRGMAEEGRERGRDVASKTLEVIHCQLYYPFPHYL